MIKIYEGKKYYEVAPGIWKVYCEIPQLEPTIEFIEDYLSADRDFIDNVEMHALEIIKLMDKIKYTIGGK